MNHKPRPGGSLLAIMVIKSTHLFSILTMYKKARVVKKESEKMKKHYIKFGAFYCILALILFLAAFSFYKVLIYI